MPKFVGTIVITEESMPKRRQIKMLLDEQVNTAEARPGKYMTGVPPNHARRLPDEAGGEFLAASDERAIQARRALRPRRRKKP